MRVIKRGGAAKTGISRKTQRGDKKPARLITVASQQTAADYKSEALTTIGDILDRASLLSCGYASGAFGRGTRLGVE
ncbi:MAG: hypothetical protein A2X82_04400 [Geobacteraceae bacterium GWC2_55_20]|nr:MAG: hypothetical protein A2X82_04400 [Geobacteraceae bacterium GWC2_55_20]OGU25008.1 MAG: hypothetical protein A2X85_11655 [Geobacteraceae bacterium GWF2_54_21]HBA72037.1 hypothetical protein [Geobacter sp.]HCE67392.1 hypothetical protein [Geobacter sp.]